jgi:ABC-type glycerol-3-phosphate transport system substrate-binding protein
LKLPSIDWTFDDFVSLIQAVASTSETDPSYGFMGGGDLDMYAMLLEGRNIQWVDLTNNYQAVRFDTPDLANGLEWLEKLVKERALYYWPPQPEGVEMPAMNDSVNKFFSGQAAFWDSRVGSVNGLGTAFTYFGKTPSFKVGIVPLPVMSVGSDAFSWSLDRGLYISRLSKNPQACWTWMKYLSDHSVALHGVPARNSVASSPEWEAIVGADMAQIYREATSRVNHTYNDSSNNKGRMSYPMREWQGNALTAVFQGKDAVTALAEAQRKADAYLSCLKDVDPAKLSASDVKAKIITCATQADPQVDWAKRFG